MATALTIARPFAAHLRLFHLQLSPGEAVVRAPHGISAQVHLIRERSGPVAHQLQRVAAQLEADLLVVGGFGHGQFREQMFGGVTQSLIHEAMLPVFMVH